jgi:hypothetical protein
VISPFQELFTQVGAGQRVYNATTKGKKRKKPRQKHILQYQAVETCVKCVESCANFFSFEALAGWLAELMHEFYIHGQYIKYNKYNRDNNCASVIKDCLISSFR